MARLASETKMGFYPTDTKTIKKVIDATIDFQDKKVVALDCCAGNGEALEFIKKEYNAITYAVELDESRAINIVNNTSANIVLNANALTGVRKSNQWVGLNFLNPPYDIDSLGNRLELSFIERWGLSTVIGGIMILVINPSSADEDMAKTLRKQGYKPIYSFFDPDNKDYKRFGQFFIVLQKRMNRFRASLDSFIEIFNSPIDLSTNDLEIEKLLIKQGCTPQLFKEIEYPRWKIDENLRKSNLKNQFFNQLKDVRLFNSSIEHPNEGQAAILIASGALNKKITLKNGDEVILKGTTQKIQKEISKTGSSGAVESVKVIEAYKTISYGLNLTHGQFIKYT